MLLFRTGGLLDCNNLATSVGLTRDGTATTSGGLLFKELKYLLVSLGMNLTGIITADSYLV